MQIFFSCMLTAFPLQSAVFRYAHSPVFHVFSDLSAFSSLYVVMFFYNVGAFLKDCPPFPFLSFHYFISVTGACLPLCVQAHGRVVRAVGTPSDCSHGWQI